MIKVTISKEYYFDEIELIKNNIAPELIDEIEYAKMHVISIINKQICEGVFFTDELTVEINQL